MQYIYAERVKIEEIGCIYLALSLVNHRQAFPRLEDSLDGNQCRGLFLEESPATGWRFTSYRFTLLCSGGSHGKETAREEILRVGARAGSSHG